ncbi:hypothetical protein SLEP1_g15489 [Rubroshorea leprosula]|uniref:Dynamin-related protein 3A-like n=1 Tax=Rubroshorea leprosula TaxID=152421 RepID=A0AAV5IZ75_9ROSI|nr:hypothetical protein SLEP1_g15489 [Rubroshorea leprosula]
MGEDIRANVTIGASVIPVINKLQDILATVGGELSKISLPQVVVVGSQSSGKSSVLEALVGRDFLPRGCDICTRRPLVLMLENRARTPEDDGREWGEFRHLPGRRFHDFSKIRKEIQAETEKEAGFNKGVSDKHIRLKISSPNVLNMTLVDLPGITKVPVGDQPSDIEARIRRMIMSHITQENCIILAVSPANSDLATSDALQIAKEADPTGSRTIGVITKLDIMDRGTNACNFLLGKVVPLRLGYVGVVNRSQEDINKERGIQEALAYEEQFFRDHPVYNGLSDRCGIPQLAKKLNQILEQHIRTALPSLKAELNSYMALVARDLKVYGEVVQSEAEQGMMLLNIIKRYCEDFSAMVDGKGQEILTSQLYGGARIHYIFQSIFVKTLEDIDPCEDLTGEDIQIAIQNATGPRSAIFGPEVPFEVLVRRQISQLLDPCLQCLQFVYDELIKMSRTCESTDLQRFPFLQKHLKEVAGKFLRDAVRPAERMIENLIEMEMGYINSSHPQFISGSKAVELAMHQIKSSQENKDVERVPTTEKGQKSWTGRGRSVVNSVPNHGNHSHSNNDRPKSAGSSSSARTWGIPSIFGSKASSDESQLDKSPGETPHDVQRTPATVQLMEPPSILRPPEITENETVEMVATKILLQSYFDVVRKNIEDLVPKAIMHFLVNPAKTSLHNTFIQKLYRQDLFEVLLQEQDEVAAKRKRAREMFLVLQQTVQTIDEVESDMVSQSENASSTVDINTGLPRILEISSGSTQLPMVYISTVT